MLQVADIGIILQSPDGKEFRNVVFRDLENLKESTYKVFQNARPYLWKSIEKMEKNQMVKTIIAGHIEDYNGVDIVMFEGESAQDVFRKQHKADEIQKIGRNDANGLRNESNGYITDLNYGNSMTQKWIPIDDSAKRIKFRYFHFNHKYNSRNHSFFEWSNWYELI